MFSKLKEYFSAILNLLTAAGVFLISFCTDFRIPDTFVNVKLVGIIIVYLGIGIVIWAAIYLKKAIKGIVEPRLSYLVKSGPYKYFRHPVYFGITISLIGVAISLRNWLGCLSVLLLFLPSVIYRARLEEKALNQKFGSEWREYVQNTKLSKRA